MSLDWIVQLAEDRLAKPVECAGQLTPLATTRGELLAQLANANTMLRTPVVIAYIAESRRRLRTQA